MATETEKLTPPYASYRSFMNFVNGLRESSIPARIDRTVFGNTSGATVYSVMAALKYLRLIDGDGAPSERLRRLVNSEGEERRAVLREILQDGYPALWGGRIDLKTATSGQFDELIREEYGAKGSTVDKIASFFLAAAEDAGIEVSSHLKSRRPAAASNNVRKARRSKKQQKTEEPADVKREAAPVRSADKPLDYQLVDLLKEPDMSEGDREAVWTLLRFLASKKTGEGPDRDAQ